MRRRKRVTVVSCLETFAVRVHPFASRGLWLYTVGESSAKFLRCSKNVTEVFSVFIIGPDRPESGHIARACNNLNRQVLRHAIRCLLHLSGVRQSVERSERKWRTVIVLTVIAMTRPMV